MAEKLTLQQQLAVDDRGGDLLVSAAAGSGKTKVLVERLMKYITDPVSPVNIDDFLIITYTKAAAAELRGKIAKALTQRIAADPGNVRLQQQFQRLYLAKISTVHAFCSDILREFSYMLDIPGDFRMIEELEDKPLRYQVLDRLLTEAYEAIEQDSDFAAFVDTQGVGRNDKQLPDLILKVYDSAQCHMDSEGWLQKCVDDVSADSITDASQTIWGKYLMQRLFCAIDLHMEALDKSVALSQQSEGLEKMTQILQDIQSQLKTLRQANSWDAIHNHRQLDGGNIKGIGNRKNIDKEAYAKLKVIRELCLEDMASHLRDFGNSSQQILEDLHQILPATRGLVGLVRRFTVRYDKVKRAMRVMDFSDLEHKTLDLFWGKSRSGPTAIASQIGQRYCQIMVDEYQDSNQVQDAIFSALSSGRNNLFMVGDVKQSIYQFRLADPGIFLDKYARFLPATEAKPGQGRKIVLSNNFRSGPEVIEAVNSVFRGCMSPTVGGLVYGDDEALWEGVPRDPLPDGKVELHVVDVESDTYAEEADYVADRIVELLDGQHMVRGENGLRPIRPEDIVILLRSPKNTAWDYQYALQKRGLQTVSSHSINLLTTDEVEWLRSLLQTVNNPRQDIPLIAALAGPVFGFTADDLAYIRGQHRAGSFYDALRLCDLDKACKFLDILSQLRDAARMNTLPQLLESVFSFTQADAVYAAMADGSMRSENLREFYQFAVRFSSMPGADLPQFLNHLQQCETDGLKVNRQGAATGCIQITSIHKSKGLEYPVVFLCGLSRLFNMRSASGTLLCDSDLGLGLSCVDNSNRIRYPSIANCAISRKLKSDSISEELRVLYVAMTRPKDRLIMTFSQAGMGSKLSELAIRMDLCPNELLTSRVHCLGSWVLLTAMRRTEAGQLFSAGLKPEESTVSQMPWDIRFFESSSVDVDTPIVEDTVSVQTDKETVNQLRQSLAFVYSHQSATVIPSKQTATQIKGRQKDLEASENTRNASVASRLWREPGFAKKQDTGRAFGNAVHTVMQRLDISSVDSPTQIAQQITGLVADGFITAEQAEIIQPEKIHRFFMTDIGQKLRSGVPSVREFKFSILVDAPDIPGEKILMQGVVDCALIEDDGITVVDFKTDRITRDNLFDTVEQYRPQVNTYADALSRIYERPIKQKALYFFSADHLQLL